MAENSILLPHNIKTYQEAKEKLENQGKVVIVQPTGTGKSYIMFQLLHDYYDDYKIVVAPSNHFLNNLQENKFWVSNKTVTVTYAWMCTHVDELELAFWDLGIKLSDVKLIIYDELHRAYAKKWKNGFTTLNELCINAKRLGLTATPIRYVDGINVVDELFDGQAVSNMSIKDAINQNILPQLTYVIGMLHIDSDMDTLQKLADEHAEFRIVNQYIKDIKARWNFKNHFINTIKNHLDLEKTTNIKHIVFFHSIDLIDELADNLEEWFKEIYVNKKINIYIIHSKLSQHEIIKRISKFDNNDEENTVDIALSINMLNEGYHIENINSLILFRGTNSPIAYIQQLGRALSVSGSSPIIFDFVDNIYSVGEVFDNFKIKRKHTKVPKLIFENGKWKEANLTSIERANLNKRKQYMIDSSFEDGIFKEIIDEAGDIEDKVNYILSLCYSINENTFNLFNQYIKDTKYGTIYDIDDKDIFNWCKWVIETKYSKELAQSEIDIYTKYNDLYAISDFILKVGGQCWYDLYKEVLDGSISAKRLKLFNNYNEMMYMRRKLNKVTAKKLEDKGIIVDITNNKEKMEQYYNEYKESISKITQDRISKIQSDYLINHLYDYDRMFTNIYRYLSSVKSATHIVSKQEIPLIVTLYYVDILKNEIDEYIKENNLQNLNDEHYKLARQFIKVYKSGSYSISSIDDLRQYNDTFCNVNTFDELPEYLRLYFEDLKICTMDRIKSYLLKTSTIYNIESHIRSKLNGISMTKRIDRKAFKKLIESSEEECIKYRNYNWCDIIMYQLETLENLIQDLKEIDSIEDNDKIIQAVIDYITPKKEIIKNKEELNISKCENSLVDKMKELKEKNNIQVKSGKDEKILFLVACIINEDFEKGDNINKKTRDIIKKSIIDYCDLLDYSLDKIDDKNTLTLLKIIGDNIIKLCKYALGNNNRLALSRAVSSIESGYAISSEDANRLNRMITVDDSAFIPRIMDCNKIVNSNNTLMALKNCIYN